MSNHPQRFAWLTIMVLLLTASLASSQGTGQATPAACSPTGPQLPFCKAVRGDRAEGWLPQTRSEVMAQNGIVSTSQPLAAQAGLRILMQGGNAVDAAVATAAVLNVVEPMNVGIAGDLFAIVYIAKDKKLYQINASGKAPTGATPARYEQLGWKCAVNTGPGCGMPTNGILAVTVPGTVDGWDQLLKRFGTMTFKQVLQPAFEYAEYGFPVSERISHEWTIPGMYGTQCCSKIGQDPDTIAAWTINGHSPRPGEIYKNPDLAHALRLLQEKGRDAFYKGEIAAAIVEKSKKLGGTMTMEDLADYHAEWVDPASTTYEGNTVYELRPPSQAWATLEMLNILEQCSQRMLGAGNTLANVGPASPAFWHYLVEAKKLAYGDLYAYNGDPNFVTVPLGTLLSKAYAASLCPRINSTSSIPAMVTGNTGSDTIVLSAADRWGNMVSFVNSNYSAFGAGITVPGYGFLLHNRGALFSLYPSSPNLIAPHKRPFNTLSAGFALKSGGEVLAFQLMGGTQQAQGHMQVLVNMFDLGANLQAATDMARFSHNQATDVLQLESQLYQLVGTALVSLGHTHTVTANGTPMGGFQSILFTPSPAAGKSPQPSDRNCEAGQGKQRLNCKSVHVDGFYRAGSDHRKDGEAVGW
jgi:gamma-glutamyltranspeptidase/glutathione hydrolase